MTKKVLILGGGISGLSSAWNLVSSPLSSGIPRHSDNLHVTLLESSSRFGGWVQTETRKGAFSMIMSLAFIRSEKTFFLNFVK
jgi:protoporphyrinogen oxidase